MVQIEGRGHGSAHIVWRPVAPVDRRRPRIRPRIGEAHRPREGRATGQDHVGPRVHARIDVRHRHRGHVEAHAAAVVDAHRHREHAVVGVGVAQREALVRVQREGQDARPVAVVDGGAPRVHVWIHERPGAGEGAPLVDRAVGTGRDDRDSVRHEHIEGRLTDAPVVVRHRHRHREVAPPREGVRKREALVGVEHQGHRPGPLAPVDRADPGVGPGIGEAARPREGRTDAGEHLVAAGEHRRRDVVHRHCRRRHIVEQAVADLELDGEDPVVGPLDHRRHPDGVIEDTVEVEIPGVGQRVAIGVARSAPIEGPRRALVEHVGAVRVRHRRQVRLDEDRREVRQGLRRHAVDVHGTAQRVEGPRVPHLEPDEVGPGIREGPGSSGQHGVDIDVVEEDAVVVEIPLEAGHPVTGIDVEAGAPVERERDPRRRSVGPTGAREGHMRRLGRRDLAHVDVGLGRRAVVGDPQPRQEDLGRITLGARIRVRVREGGDLGPIRGLEVPTPVAVEVPLVLDDRALGIGVEGARVAEVEGLVVGPDDVVPRRGDRRLHEEGGRQHDDRPRRLQVLPAVPAGAPAAPLAVADPVLGVDDDALHARRVVVVPVEPGGAEHLDRERLGEAQRLHEGEEPIVVVALGEPVVGDVVFDVAPPRVAGRDAVEGELHQARGGRRRAITRAGVPEANSVVAAVQPDLVLGVDPARQVDAEVVLRRLHPDRGPLTRRVVRPAVPTVPPPTAVGAGVDLAPGVGVAHVHQEVVVEAPLHVRRPRPGEAQRPVAGGDGVHHQPAFVDRPPRVDLDADPVAVAVGVVARWGDGDRPLPQRAEEIVEAGVDGLDVGVLLVVAILDVAVDQHGVDRARRGAGAIARVRGPGPRRALLDGVHPPQPLVLGDEHLGVEIVGGDHHIVGVLPQQRRPVPDADRRSVDRVDRAAVGVGLLDHEGVRHRRHRRRRGAVAEVDRVGQRPRVPRHALDARRLSVEDRVKAQPRVVRLVDDLARHAHHRRRPVVRDVDRRVGAVGLVPAVHHRQPRRVHAFDGVDVHRPATRLIDVVGRVAITVAVVGDVDVPQVLDDPVVVTRGAAIEVRRRTARAGDVGASGVGDRRVPGHDVDHRPVRVGLTSVVEDRQVDGVVAIGAPVDVARRGSPAELPVAEVPLPALDLHVVGRAQTVEHHRPMTLGGDLGPRLGDRCIAVGQRDLQSVEVTLQRVVGDPQRHRSRAGPHEVMADQGAGALDVEAAVVVEIPLVEVDAVVIARSAAIEVELPLAAEGRRLILGLVGARRGHRRVVGLQRQGRRVAVRLLYAVHHVEAHRPRPQPEQRVARRRAADDLSHLVDGRGARVHDDAPAIRRLRVVRAPVEPDPVGIAVRPDVVVGALRGPQRDPHVVLVAGDDVVARVAAAAAALVDVDVGAVEVQRVRVLAVVRVGVVELPAQHHVVAAGAHGGLEGGAVGAIHGRGRVQVAVVPVIEAGDGDGVVLRRVLGGPLPRVDAGPREVVRAQVPRVVRHLGVVRRPGAVERDGEPTGARVPRDLVEDVGPRGLGDRRRPERRRHRQGVDVALARAVRDPQGDVAHADAVVLVDRLSRAIDLERDPVVVEVPLVGPDAVIVGGGPPVEGGRPHGVDGVGLAQHLVRPGPSNRWIARGVRHHGARGVAVAGGVRDRQIDR